MSGFDSEYSEKLIMSNLYDEEYVNKLLLNFNFVKPKTLFDIYIKERFKDNEDLYNRNIYIKKKEPLFLEKYNTFVDDYNNLSEDELIKYNLIYEEENFNYLRSIEILKKYIFKGVDGNIKIKATAFHLFLNDEIINGLENGSNVNSITNKAFKKWENLDPSLKQKYYLKKKYNDSFLDIVQNYNKINSFLVFVYHYLNKNQFNIKNFPTLKQLVELFKELPEKKQLIYEEYSNQFLFLKFKIRDIYDSIHGITTKTPSGALRIFLQEKAIKYEISSVKEGIDEWNRLGEDEKEIYLTKFKYKNIKAYYLIYIFFDFG